MRKKSVKKKKKLTDRRLEIEQRNKELYRRYLEIDKPHSEALAELTELGIISRATLYVLAKAENWIVAKEEHKRELEIKKLEEQVKVIEAGAPIKKDVPLSSVVTKIKDFVWQMLTSAEEVASVASMMIRYYKTKIDQLVTNAGGMTGLTTIQAQEVESWAKEMRRYQDQVAEFLKPTAMAALLKMIGIEAAIDPNNPDGSALTMAQLQEALPKLRDKVETMSNEEIEAELLGDTEIPDIQDRGLADRIRIREKTQKNDNRDNVAEDSSFEN